MRYARPLILALTASIAAAAMPLVAFAALVNINTADLTTLETLPGIGPSKGQAIIDYRTQHGSFAAIADIQNVSGIGPSTYANISALITVDSGSSSGSESTTTTTSTTTTAAVAAGSSGGTHAPPRALTIDIGSDRQATLHTPVSFYATVSAFGSADPYAKVLWSFGDGASAEGYAADAIYDIPGTYVVTATAVDGAAKAQAMVTVTVGAATVRIAALDVGGIIIANESAERLNLSGWMLVAGAGNFRIPEGTWLAPGAHVHFSARATKLAPAGAAVLAYPDGSVAASYPPSAPPPVQGAAQPIAARTGSQQVQTVEPALTSSNAVSYVGGPAPTGSNAGGAARDASTSLASAAAGTSSGLLHSRWTLGLLGIAVFAGGAFMIL